MADIQLTPGTASQVTLVAQVPTAVAVSGAPDLRFESFVLYLKGATLPSDDPAYPKKAKATDPDPLTVVSYLQVALEDGTLLQGFPQLFDPSQSSETRSRNLAGEIAAPWAASQGKLRLLLTSQSTGRISLKVDLRGWRTLTTTQAIAVHPFVPQTVAIPLSRQWQKATVKLVATADSDGGRRTRMTAPAGAGARPCAVRVTESREIAQGFRLRLDEHGQPTDATLEALRISAAWLCLPAVPPQAQKVDLRIAQAGDDDLPDPLPLARWQANLPPNVSDYVLAEGGYWFRAPCPEPVVIDGSLAGRRLYLVASGHSAGTLLSHQAYRADPQSGDEQAAPYRRLEGEALYVNLTVDRTWRPQRYDDLSCQWWFELELLPDDPASALLDLSIPGLQPAERQDESTDAQVTTTVTWKGMPVSADKVTVQLRSRTAGTVSVATLAQEE